MQPKFLLLALSLLVLSGAAFAGCTGVPGTTPTPVPTTAVPTATPTQGTPATTVSTVVTTATTIPTEPMVTQTIPLQYAIDVTIQKDRVYNTITVIFDGGPGQVFVQEIKVTVTNSDGTVTTRDIPQSGQIQDGASVEFQGTKGRDRVEVWATINGVTYKIRDEYAYFPSY